MGIEGKYKIVVDPDSYNKLKFDFTIDSKDEVWEGSVEFSTDERGPTEFTWYDEAPDDTEELEPKIEDEAATYMGKVHKNVLLPSQLVQLFEEHGVDGWQDSSSNNEPPSIGAVYGLGPDDGYMYKIHITPRNQFSEFSIDSNEPVEYSVRRHGFGDASGSDPDDMFTTSDPKLLVSFIEDNTNDPDGVIYADIHDMKGSDSIEDKIDKAYDLIQGLSDEFILSLVKEINKINVSNNSVDNVFNDHPGITNVTFLGTKMDLKATPFLNGQQRISFELGGHETNDTQMSTNIDVREGDLPDDKPSAERFMKEYWAPAIADGLNDYNPAFDSISQIEIGNQYILNKDSIKELFTGTELTYILNQVPESGSGVHEGKDGHDYEVGYDRPGRAYFVTKVREGDNEITINDKPETLDSLLILGLEFKETLWKDIKIGDIISDGVGEATELLKITSKYLGGMGIIVKSSWTDSARKTLHQDRKYVGDTIELKINKQDSKVFKLKDGLVPISHNEKVKKFKEYIKSNLGQFTKGHFEQIGLTKFKLPVLSIVEILHDEKLFFANSPNNNRLVYHMAWFSQFNNGSYLDPKEEILPLSYIGEKYGYDEDFIAESRKLKAGESHSDGQGAVLSVYSEWDNKKFTRELTDRMIEVFKEAEIKGFTQVDDLEDRALNEMWGGIRGMINNDYFEIWGEYKDNGQINYKVHAFDKDFDMDTAKFKSDSLEEAMYFIMDSKAEEIKEKLLSFYEDNPEMTEDASYHSVEQDIVHGGYAEEKLPGVLVHVAIEKILEVLNGTSNTVKIPDLEGSLVDDSELTTQDIEKDIQSKLEEIVLSNGRITDTKYLYDYDNSHDRLNEILSEDKFITKSEAKLLFLYISEKYEILLDVKDGKEDENYIRVNYVSLNHNDSTFELSYSKIKGDIILSTSDKHTGFQSGRITSSIQLIKKINTIIGYGPLVSNAGGMFLGSDLSNVNNYIVDEEINTDAIFFMNADNGMVIYATAFFEDRQYVPISLEFKDGLIVNHDLGPIAIANIPTNPSEINGFIKEIYYPLIKEVIDLADKSSKILEDNKELELIDPKRAAESVSRNMIKVLPEHNLLDKHYVYNNFLDGYLATNQEVRYNDNIDKSRDSYESNDDFMNRLFNEVIILNVKYILGDENLIIHNREGIGEVEIVSEVVSVEYDDSNDILKLIYESVDNMAEPIVLSLSITKLLDYKNYGEITVDSNGNDILIGNYDKKIAIQEEVDEAVHGKCVEGADIPEYILTDIRESYGYDENDDSYDDEICKKTLDELMEKYLTYNGIIGYTNRIMDLVNSKRSSL